MRILIIGGTGHVGTYLVPRLVQAGHDVTCITRGNQQPYLPDACWQMVEHVIVDREVEEESGIFGDRVRAMAADVIIDMICFKVESARILVEALRGRIQHFLHCGTIWVHGASVQVPTIEDAPRRPFGAYGIQKAEIETYLLKEARQNGFPVTILHPGHIVGQGWWPLNPAGNFNPEVFMKLARGEELVLPNHGMETVHHVHADDVAQSFMQAITNRSCAIGESFHVVSPAALTLLGYAQTISAWFGKQANLRFLPWEQWRTQVAGGDANSTWDHIAHSPNCSIDKARRLLNYQPRYSSLEAVKESLAAMIAQGMFKQAA